MKKSYLMLAAAAALFAACSGDDLATESPTVAQPTVDDGSVQFDVYVNRGTTRAGVNGVLTTSTITTSSHKDAGFGVFGYYTDGEPYAGNTKPNFFYNQQVTYDGSKWIYSPIKYWPNEFGSDAASDEVDRISLFAYAPWVEVDGLTGLVISDKENNIVSMTRNTANGDPFIKYVASMNAANSVDLCYGVAAEAFTSSNSTANTNNIEVGKPFVDLKKPATDDGSRVKWNFKHALAQMVVTLDANVTNLTNNATDVDANTRIWVRSITFTGVTQKGSLNLHDGLWYDVNGVNQITTGSITVYDGRKDGREANDAASNETPATFNPKFVQNTSYTVDASYHITAPATTQGVNATTSNLFENAVSSNPIFVIPTNEDMEVTIVYDVETADKNLSSVLSDGQTKGSTIENTISKKLTTLGHIVAGKCYTIALHLGMRSVDFDATVTDFVPYVAPVDLPSNTPAYTALADPSSALGTVTIPASATSYVYQVTDLPATTAVTATATNGTSDAAMSSDPTVDITDGASTLNQSSSTGVTYATVTVPANTTTWNKNCTVAISCGGKGGILTINQQAHALGLAFASSTDANTIAVSTSATLSPTVSDVTSGTIHIYDLTADPNRVTELYTSTGSSGLVLKTSSSLISGHTYEVSVTNNDVTESITFAK